MKFFKRVFKRLIEQKDEKRDLTKNNIIKECKKSP